MMDSDTAAAFFIGAIVGLFLTLILTFGVLGVIDRSVIEVPAERLGLQLPDKDTQLDWYLFLKKHCVCE